MIATEVLGSPVDVMTDDSEATHAVCDCQVDARPRLALCNADCTDEPEGGTPTPCVVCLDLIRPFLLAGGHCERCRGDR